MHPKHLLDDEDLSLLELYAVMRGGMSPGPLPFSGGYAEQPAALMQALRYMGGVAAAVERYGRQVEGRA